MNSDLDLGGEGIPFKVALVGFGKMGLLHARAFQASPGVEVIGAFDADTAKRSLIETMGFAPVTSIESLSGLADAVIVATPAETHSHIAVPLLERGVHCLIEKPLALSTVEAEQMMSAATKGNALLAVGHNERFNWSLHNAIAALGSEGGSVEIIRNSFPNGVSDKADVVQDLMVHDLDWIIHHENAPARSIEVLGSVFGEAGLSEVSCKLTFDSRAYDLHVSHRKSDKTRNIKIARPNVAEQQFDLSQYRRSDGLDPLEWQAGEFVKFCKGRPSLVSTGEHATEVLSIAEKVRRLCHEHDCAC